MLEMAAQLFVTKEFCWGTRMDVIFGVLWATPVKRRWWEQLGAPVVWCFFTKQKFPKHIMNCPPRNGAVLLYLMPPAVSNPETDTFRLQDFSSKEVCIAVFIWKEMVLFFWSAFWAFPEPPCDNSHWPSYQLTKQWFWLPLKDFPHLPLSLGAVLVLLLRFYVCPYPQFVLWPNASFSINELGPLAATCGLQPQQEPLTLFPGSASQMGSKTSWRMKLWLCPQRRGTLLPASAPSCRNEWGMGTHVSCGAAFPQETKRWSTWLFSGGVISQAGQKSPSRPRYFPCAFSVCVEIGLGEGCSCFSKTPSYCVLKLWNCVQLQKMKSLLALTR